MATSFQNIGEVWQRAGLFQRVLLLGVLAGCVGGGVLLVNWARQPSMALLYSGLSPDEAAKIVDRVRDAGVPYELRAGGGSVYVPVDQVYSMRLAMASAGLPTGGNPGYQILEDGAIGASPFAERVKFNRAVEGEIARTIQTLEAVTAARVHVVRPEAPLFRGKTLEASATVALTLAPGRSLTSANVAAIAYMVAGSVEGLVPERVVVVDSHGDLLSGETGDKISSKIASALEQKRSAERYLATKAEEHLALVLGPNRATVQVAVQMNTTTTETETKRVGPDRGVTIREMTKEKKSTDPPAEKGAEAGTTTDMTTEMEYKVTETLEKTMVLAGGITSKTVSVIVDLTPRAKQEGAPEPKALASKDVEEIVRSALGLNETTDKLTVKEASFYRPPEVAAAGTVDQGLFNKDFILEIAKRSSLGLLVIGALLVLRMFRGPKRKPGGEPTLMAATGGMLEGRPLPATGGLLPAGGGDSDSLRAQITQALQENPEEVKRLFLRWAESEKGEG